jgi:hypothetical protein
MWNRATSRTGAGGPVLLLFLFTFNAILHPSQQVVGQEKDPVLPCTICRDDVSITLPDVLLTVPGFGPLTCGVVDASVAIFLPDESTPECELLRSVGTLCGCPKTPTACDLCIVDSSGDAVPASRAEAPLDFFNEKFLGGPVTCKVVEAYLHTVDQSNTTCPIAQGLLREYCCQEDYSPPTEACKMWSAVLTKPDESVSLPDFPVETCGQVQDAAALLVAADTDTCELIQSIIASDCCCTAAGKSSPSNQCTLCTDQSGVTTPDRKVPFLVDQFLGIEPTCAQIDASVRILEAGSDDCREAQLIGSYCGCPAVDDACVFCPIDDITMP